VRPATRLKVVYERIEDLVEHPQNARTHSKRQIAQIAASVEAYGWTNPVIVDKRKRIIAGHGRVAAAKLRGIREIPTICIEHLTEDEIRAYVIADNALALKAGWAPEILAIELQYLLKLDDFDITLTGFEVPEIDAILEQATGRQDKDDVFEQDPSLPAVTRPGDVWGMAGHRVLCGNSLQDSSFDALMAGLKANLVFTDPPYGVKVNGHVSGRGAIKHREFLMGSGEMSPAERLAFLRTATQLLSKHSSPSAIQFICIDHRHIGELLVAAESAYGAPLNLCVWVKDNGGLGSLYRSRHELIFVFRNGRKPHRNNVLLGKYGRNRTNVWEYPGISTMSKRSEEGNLLALHPTVKPVALVADAILDCSARKDVVVDSFLGSGTTLIACERTGRVCYGIELDPLYVDTAVRRWERYTGEKAVNAASGKRFDDLAAKPKGGRRG